jgi:hypothetical protein
MHMLAGPESNGLAMSAALFRAQLKECVAPHYRLQNRVDEGRLPDEFSSNTFKAPFICDRRGIENRLRGAKTRIASSPRLSPSETTTLRLHANPSICTTSKAVETNDIPRVQIPVAIRDHRGSPSKYSTAVVLFPQ